MLKAASSEQKMSERSEISVSNYSTLTRPASAHGLLRTGLLIGLAGGLAEIVAVSLYSAATGGNAAMVARHVASAVGLDGASALTGILVHMGLAVALGIALCAFVQILNRRLVRDAVISLFMIGSLALVWVINYFVVLPAVSPSFVHLLPYAVTLASKLAFGIAAAATLRLMGPLQVATIVRRYDGSEVAV
jgi:hypothetical protein